jgi:hypothetical protein
LEHFLLIHAQGTFEGKHMNLHVWLQDSLVSSADASTVEGVVVQVNGFGALENLASMEELLLKHQQWQLHLEYHAPRRSNISKDGIDSIQNMSIG